MANIIELSVEMNPPASFIILKIEFCIPKEIVSEWAHFRNLYLLPKDFFA
jgi:hypothetical protein